MPDEVFLSHSSEDQDVANSLAAVIRGHGIPVWYSETDIQGAQQWHDEIGKALQRCDFFCVLLSNASVESMWLRRETHYALRQQRYEEAIAPILLEACDYENLSWILGGLQIIDFRSSRTEGCRDLLRVWGKRAQDEIVNKYF